MRLVELDLAHFVQTGPHLECFPKYRMSFGMLIHEPVPIEIIIIGVMMSFWMLVLGPGRNLGRYLTIMGGVVLILNKMSRLLLMIVGVDF
jgi:hypothetical protein